MGAGSDPALSKLNLRHSARERKEIKVSPAGGRRLFIPFQSMMSRDLPRDPHGPIRCQHSEISSLGLLLGHLVLPPNGLFYRIPYPISMRFIIIWGLFIMWVPPEIDLQNFSYSPEHLPQVTAPPIFGIFPRDARIWERTPFQGGLLNGRRPVS